MCRVEAMEEPGLGPGDPVAASHLLFHQDMWEGATIEWPSGEVEKIPDPEVKITPDYVNPYFFQD